MNTTPQNPLEAAMKIINGCQMRESSLRAYEEVKKDIPFHYMEIIKGLKRIGKPSTNKKISEHCKLSYHQVARRTKEMLELGYIKFCGYSDTEPRKPILWGIV